MLNNNDLANIFSFELFILFLGLTYYVVKILNNQSIISEKIDYLLAHNLQQKNIKRRNT